MKPKNNIFHHLGFIALAFAGISAPLAHAASDTWVGTTDATWATSTNWLGGSVPGTGETATFNNAGNGNTTVSLGAGVTLGSLLFDTASTAAYTIGAGAVGSQTLTLGTVGNAITVNSTVAANQSINANLSLSVTRTVANPATYYAVTNNSTNALALAGGISASTAGVKVLNVTGTGNTAVSGAITSGSGNMSLFKTGTGTLTLSGGGTFSGVGVRDGAAFDSSAVFREGTTILNGGTYSNSGGEPVIGGVATHGGAGTNTTLQLDNGAIFNNISWLAIGRGNGNGTATSYLTLNGSSSITSANLSAGFNAGNVGNIPKGAITLSSTSSITIDNELNLGDSAGSDMTMTLNGSATFNANGTGNNKRIGRDGNGTLTLNDTSTANFGGDVFIGTASNSLGKLVINGGTVNMATGPSKWMFLGGAGTSRGQLDITAGSLKMLSNAVLNLSNGNSTGQNVVNQDGGSVTFYSNGGATPTVGGTGTLNMQRNNSANSNTVYNLNGGTLTVPRIISEQTTGTRVFNFNGGTLRAAVATATFMNLGGGNARANVRNGGAIIDTNGLNVTAVQPLLHSNVDGDNATDGGLTKQGAGTLTLSGANTYTGPTTISAGGLSVISPGSINSSAVSLGAATLGGNGTLGAVTVNNAGAVISNGNANTDTLNLGSLTFTTGATLNLNKFNDSSTPALAITGNLATTSGITINIPVGPVWANGDYDLISFGSGPVAGPTSHLTVGSIAGLGGRQSGTLSSTGSSIILTIGGDIPVWTGVGSQTWTTAPTNNHTGPNAWALKNGHTATNFWANDSVEFNDTYHLGSGDVAVSNSTVTIHGGVAPANVTFNNTTSVDYVIASDDSTGITTGTLSKNGDGIVTLNTTNSYTGATVINAGTLRLGDGTTNGDIASSSSIANDGTLILNRSTGSFSYANATSGFGEIIKNGAGTQIFAGASTRNGITTINAGTLQIGNAGLTGALGFGSITNDASLVFNRTNGVVQGTADFGFIEGAGSVTQAGSGAVTLSFGNTYEGGTNITSGSVIVGATNALGTGTVTLAGGTLSGSGVDVTLANPLFAQASTTSVLFTSGKNLTLNGNLTGSGNINRTATGAAATVWLGGDNSGFSGTFTADANAAAATRFTAATAGSQAAKWVINQSNNTRATLDFAGGTIKFGSLTGTGFLTGNSLAINTIEVGALGLSETFSGVLHQLTGSTIAVTKVGAGTWTLTGDNTYTGDTTVNAGVLAVDGNAIANANKLVINGGQVNPMGATEVVGTLYFGATQQASGTYSAVAGPGVDFVDAIHFTGTGIVSVTTGPAGYTTWAAANNAASQTVDQDHDNDGVDNGIEYFIGGPNGNTTGFTALPTVTTVAGVRSITWAHAAAYTGTYGAGFVVETSATLAAGSWTTETVGGNVAVSGNNVTYTFPAGPVKNFVRLVVSN